MIDLGIQKTALACFSKLVVDCIRDFKLNPSSLSKMALANVSYEGACVYAAAMTGRGMPLSGGFRDLAPPLHW